MKVLAAVVLCLALTGCPNASSPTPPLAPGYTSTTDQQFGQALAAARALANQAVIDYGKLTPAQQAPEKNPLNAFVAAVNAADTIYAAYHMGQATSAEVQTALTRVNSTQASYASIATGGK